MQHPFSRHIFQVFFENQILFQIPASDFKTKSNLSGPACLKMYFPLYSWPLLILSVECLMSLVFFKDKNLLPIILSLCTQTFQIFRVDQELTLLSFLLQTEACALSE